MYKKAFGVIETLAPLHVGATAGEESGNLNLIFRDQFTQTGIVPGSSIRGRLRADMRMRRQRWLEQELLQREIAILDEADLPQNPRTQKPLTKLQWLERTAQDSGIELADATDENLWYGQEARPGEPEIHTSESWVKFEYASILWLPVFCPGQPIVWVTCPRLLKRYQRIAGEQELSDGRRLKDLTIPSPYTGSSALEGKALTLDNQQKLFFNFGFLTLSAIVDLSDWFPLGTDLPAVVVDDDEIGMIHDMALYRQSRVKLHESEKRVDDKAFFNTEALPEGTIMVFPIALRERQAAAGQWNPFEQSNEVYLGGLESIGFGNCEITLKGIAA
jgi:CRISPR-associated protein Cmr4